MQILWIDLRRPAQRENTKCGTTSKVDIQASANANDQHRMGGGGVDTCPKVLDMRPGSWDWQAVTATTTAVAR